MGNRVVQISPGFNHVAYLLEDGTVKVCGDNAYGKLGLGNKDSITTPAVIPGLKGVKRVDAFGANTTFILDDGSCMACGPDMHRLLGMTAFADEYLLPTPSSLKDVLQCNLTGYSGFYFLEDKSVYVCGLNQHGVLGLGTTTRQDTPIRNANLDGVVQMACSIGGIEFAAFLMENGTVKCTGSCNRGQFGPVNDVNTTPVTVPGLTNVKQVACGGTFSLCLFNDGTVSLCGEIHDFSDNNSLITKAEYTSFTKIGNILNVKQIACGYGHYACLCNDGSVFTGGAGKKGQLGTGSTDYISFAKVPDLQNVTAVACGAYETFFLLADGTVRGCGMNNQGMLGLGDTEQRNTPTVIDALTPTAQEPEPEPEPGVDAKEITVRVHQKTADGYRRIRFDDNGTAVNQLKVTAAENDVVDIALEQPLSAGRNAPEVLVLTEKGTTVNLTVEESTAKLEGVVNVNVNVTGPESMEGGVLYKTDAIDFSVFRSVEGIEVV